MKKGDDMNDKKQETKDEFNITEIIKESKEKLKEGLVETAINELRDSLSWRLKEDVGNIAAEFIEKEIKPELAKHLIDKKAAILKGLLDGIDKIGKELSRKMTEKAFKSLSEMHSYQFEDILKKIF
jgi:hypothetical protein